MAVDLLAEMVSEPALDADDVDGRARGHPRRAGHGQRHPRRAGRVAARRGGLPRPRARAGRCSAGPRPSTALDRRPWPASTTAGTGAPTLVVAAAGAVDHDELVDAGRRLVPPTAPTTRPTRAAPDAPPTATTHRRARTASRSTCPWVGAACRIDDRDRWALAVLLHVLGDGPSSRLYREVRDERGLAYSIGSGARGLLRRRPGVDQLRRHQPPRGRGGRGGRRPAGRRSWPTA